MTDLSHDELTFMNSLVEPSSDIFTIYLQDLARDAGSAEPWPGFDEWLRTTREYVPRSIRAALGLLEKDLLEVVVRDERHAWRTLTGSEARVVLSDERHWWCNGVDDDLTEIYEISGTRAARELGARASWPYA